MRGQLKRDIRREELTRTEEAARTEKDFEELIKEWNKWDSNSERRVRYYVADIEEMTVEDIEITDRAVIPQPLYHRWWRQMMRGKFLDVIFDCHQDIHELTSSAFISKLLESLSDNQKEILFFRVIWQWSPQKIATMREQTDRNIRKVYDTLIEGMRKKLYDRLYLRYAKNLPLTFAQNEFVENNIKKYGGKLKEKNNRES